MILVTVGTNEVPFDRLLKAVGDRPSGEEMVVQHGPSAVRPVGAECCDFVSYGRLVEYAQAARVVVAHAGAGSILMAVHAGKRPIVMPRLRRYREAVDDHQLPLARRMREIGLVELVEDAEDLAPWLANGESHAPWECPGRDARA